MIVDLGSGGDTERWISGSVRIDCGLMEGFQRRMGIIGIDAEQDAWPFPDNSVDEVWSRHGLTGMYWVDVLPEILRVLKPQGRLTVIGSLLPKDADQWLEIQKYENTNVTDKYKLHRTDEAIQDATELYGEPMTQFITIHQKFPNDYDFDGYWNVPDEDRW